MLVRPNKAHPSEAEWKDAVSKGFSPNGASFAPDTIYGVRIGNTSTNHRFSVYPANLHDYRYFVGGTEDDRYAADKEFLRTLKGRLKKLLPWYLYYPGRVRAQYYYLAVKWFGSNFFSYKGNRDAD